MEIFFLAFTVLCKLLKRSDAFKPQPTYTKISTSNKAWISKVVTKIDGDGNVTQTLTIVSKKS